MWIRLAAQLAAAVLALAAAGAPGQGFTSKPIRIVTAEPGSGTDLVSRLIAQGLTDGLGRPVMVENRGGMFSGDVVLRAPPDGNTLLLAGTSLWLAPFMRESVSYDPIRDFLPITLAGSSPNVLVIHPSLPVKSVKDLIALARSRPGELNY